MQNIVMGSKFLTLKLPVTYSEDDVFLMIKRKLKIKNFTFSYDLKSLDARQSNHIHWQIRVLVESDEIKGDEKPVLNPFVIPYRKRQQRIAVVGSGPAGFFAAEVLQRAGFQVTIFERGAAVEERAVAIHVFENGSMISPQANYAFGEGGAGTFSDGKLTSRTKGISELKQYVLSRYTEAGAPEEIRYLSKPHIGSNYLRNVVMNLRKQFVEHEGEVLFNTQVKDIQPAGKFVKLITSAGVFDFDLVIWATGHSAYDSFRLLISKGVRFVAKPFAVGVRVEHDQQTINTGMWRKPAVSGLKAAEYALRWQGQGSESVYSFCMCPGGKIVQAAPGEGLSIVNGMSNYLRNSQYANSAIVVPVTPEDFSVNDHSAAEMLDRIEEFEHRVWGYSNSFAIPANRISSFLQGKVASVLPQTSYSHGVFSFDFSQLFTSKVHHQLKSGLQNFTEKIKGYEDGVMMGLESKTSCAVQVLRQDGNGPCEGFGQLYVTGEGSGFAGGIVSSAVDGIKTALHILKTH